MIETIFFKRRLLWLGLCSIITLLLAWQATQLKVDAGFAKLLPLEHPFMKTLTKHRNVFGGANRILVALSVEEGDIFTADFMQSLKSATDDVFFIPGVIRGQVQSLFTPNVRYIEVVEDGFEGGNVVPADFQPTPKGLNEVKENILKAGILGRLVGNDFKAAMISANLQEVDPATGKRLVYQDVATKLEAIRARYEQNGIRVHIIGFAKVVGDITDGARQVVLFFALAAVIIAGLLRWYCGTWRLAVLPMIGSVTAVIWQLGLLVTFGFGIDPMSILVPFLIFAIGISHGVQMVNGFKQQRHQGLTAIKAAEGVFRQLVLPGGFALLSDTAGFLTILLIDIQMIQEVAITASIGVAMIIITNLFILPLLLSYQDSNLPKRSSKQTSDKLWLILSQFVTRRPAVVALTISSGLLLLGAWQSQKLAIGNLHAGVPELRQEARYNQDSFYITEHFRIGTDIIGVIAETVKDACVHPEVMRRIDDFDWQMQNVKGVHSTISLPAISKKINAAYNEGVPNWQVLPSNTASLAQTLTQIDTSTGLLNRNCSAMPVYLFTSDHKATTISHIVERAQSAAHSLEVPTNKCRKDGKLTECSEQVDISMIEAAKVSFKLATGSVGVMAATNEVVAAAQMPLLGYVYAAVFLLCWISFRSLRGTLCVILPLALVSVLANALMATLEIGLKVSTLPVVALGVGIGVDYGIYIFSRLKAFIDTGLDLQESYFKTLQETGRAVLFTGITLSIAVSTWMFSSLKFQADMGSLLAFMFLVNMLGALIILPALARWLIPVRNRQA
jgi:predicted RND superfamily exporter protein